MKTIKPFPVRGIRNKYKRRVLLILLFPVLLLINLLMCILYFLRNLTYAEMGVFTSFREVWSLYERKQNE